METFAKFICIHGKREAVKVQSERKEKKAEALSEEQNICCGEIPQQEENKMNYWVQGPGHIYVAAHRGLSDRYPENTMLAFEKALEAEADQIETDVRVTKDGVLVLSHNGNLDRATDGKGSVEEHTYEELRGLNASRLCGWKFSDCRIPKLEDFMDLVCTAPDTFTIDVELKEYPEEVGSTLALEVTDRVLQLIDDSGFTDRCVINTFSASQAEYIRKKYGAKYRQHVYYPKTKMKNVTLDPLSYAYCACISDDDAFAKLEAYEDVRQHGVDPWAFTPALTEQNVNALKRCGATLITCNNADEAVRVLRAHGMHP